MFCARCLFFDESGQDLLEYALLASFIGLACLGIFDTMAAAIRDTYRALNTQNNSLWSPPPPA